MLSTIIIKLALPLLMVWNLSSGYPLSETEKLNVGESLKVELQTRALEEDSDIVLTFLENKVADVEFDENPDDLELAEVNVFRPVFRYRVLSKKVKGPPPF